MGNETTARDDGGETLYSIKVGHGERQSRKLVTALRRAPYEEGAFTLKQPSCPRDLGRGGDSLAM
jgi:hypothetical protein